MVAIGLNACAVPNDAGEKEFKNTVFEDMLTEMLITLQEQIVDTA